MGCSQSSTIQSFLVQASLPPDAVTPLVLQSLDLLAGPQLLDALMFILRS